MAVRSTAASNYMASAAALPASNGTWTAMFRFKISTDTNARVRLFTLAGTGGQTISAVLSSADGTTFGVRTGTTQADGTNLTVGTWYWAALVRNGDVSTVYLDGVQDATQTISAVWTSAGIYLFSATIDGLNGCIEGFKLWDAVLSQSEIQAEMVSLAPVRTADINRWTPLTPAGAGVRDQDRSGNGRHWTENGTLTDETGSGIPIAVPVVANLSAAVQLARTASLSIGAAVQESKTAGVSASAAVREARTAAVSVAAAVQQAATAAADLSAAVRQARELAASLGAAVAASQTLQIAADAAVQEPVTATFSLSEAAGREP